MEERFRHLSVIAVIVIVASIIFMQLNKDKGIIEPTNEQAVIENGRSKTVGTPAATVAQVGSEEINEDIKKKMFPESKAEKPSGYKDPRALTEEEKAENKREIARMKEKLPGNVWIPSDGFSKADSDEQKELLRRTLTLESKIMNDVATSEEKKEYYSYQLKSAKDKVDIIKYFQTRTAELSSETGAEYFDEADIEAGNAAIVEIEKEIAEHSKKLAEL